MSKPTSYELAMLATSLAEGKPDESHFEKAWDIYQRADTFRHNMQANPESDFIRSVIKHYQRGMIAFRHESDDECPVRQYLREKGRPMQQARTVLKNIELFSAHLSETNRSKSNRKYDFESNWWCHAEGPDGADEEGTIWIHTEVLDDMVGWMKRKKSEGGRKAAETVRKKGNEKHVKK